MSRNRPGGGPRKSGTPGRPRNAPTAEAGAETQPAEASSLRRRLRAFLPVALIPNAVVVAAVVLLALCALMLTDSGFVPLAATVAQLWLAVNLAPVASDSAVLSQLPMLPALGIVWLVAHRVRVAVRHRISVLDLAVLTGCVLAVPVLLALTATAMLLDARPVLPVEVSPVPAVFGRVLLLHCAALGIGMGPKLWRALARRFSVPTRIIDPVAPAVRFTVSLGIAGLALVLVSLAVHWRVLGELLSTFDGGSAAAGLVGVSLLYLPDAAVAGAAVLVGSEFHIGDASVSLYDATVVPLPPLPILAAFPGSVAGWALALIVIPLALAGTASHAYCRTVPRTWPEMLTAGVWAGVFTLIVGGLAGGTAGVYGPSGMMVVLTAVLVAVELATVGAVVNTVVGMRRRQAGHTTPDTGADGPVRDPADPPEEPDTDPVTDGGDTDGPNPEAVVDEEDLIAAGDVVPDADPGAGAASPSGESSPDSGDTDVADPADPGTAVGVEGESPEMPAGTDPDEAEPDGTAGPTGSVESVESESGGVEDETTRAGEPATATDSSRTGTAPDHETRPLP